MNVAIVPARGGSKRVKNKNIINIGGKPMIHHTIKTLIKSEEDSIIKVIPRLR